MSDYYLIALGFTPGKKLTQAQRTSSLFAEEPVVCGKVLRRRGPPMKLTVDQWKTNEEDLLRLAKAGAIKVIEPDKTQLTKEEIEAAEAALKKQKDAEAAAATAAPALAGDQTAVAPVGGEMPPTGVEASHDHVEESAPETTVVDSPADADKVNESPKPHHKKRR